ncbi:MAG: OmpA-OmpF porin, family [Actinomycetota bacterium]|nr:OmpA-OmpF porin, family [Actinomycetota bacterium]
MGKRRAGWVAGVALVAALVAGCGGGSSSDSSSGSTTPTGATDETTADSVETSTTLPPGVTAGIDDLDQDGQPDPICSTQDFGAGLVLRVPCNAAGYAHEPTPGTTLVPNSAYGLPGIELDLTGISGNAAQARDPNGKKVVVFFISSDTLFDVGSSTLSGPAMETFDGLARVIQGNWPTAAVQVRGHTDATGSATGNQTLSEQRAAAAAAYMATKGIDGSRLSSVGLGSSVPVVLETNPDGSDNPLGRHDNRRVEFVVRVP